MTLVHTKKSYLILTILGYLIGEFYYAAVFPWPAEYLIPDAIRAGFDAELDPMKATLCQSFDCGGFYQRWIVLDFER